VARLVQPLDFMIHLFAVNLKAMVDDHYEE
jgi:hypothetical protein